MNPTSLKYKHVWLCTSKLCKLSNDCFCWSEIRFCRESSPPHDRWVLFTCFTWSGTQNVILGWKCDYTRLADYRCKSSLLKLDTNINSCASGVEIYRIHLYCLNLPESVYNSDLLRRSLIPVFKMLTNEMACGQLINGTVHLTRWRCKVGAGSMF